MIRTEEGVRGESLAAKYLEEREGYRILAKNVNFSGAGELDIVAMDGSTLAFVEVRFRSSEICGHPFDSVDKRKCAKTVRAAACYLSEYKPKFQDVRFDIVAVVGEEIELMKDAFYGKLLR